MSSREDIRFFFIQQICSTCDLSKGLYVMKKATLGMKTEYPEKDKAFQYVNGELLKYHY